MRKGIFSGETVYLTEKEWWELLERFDLSKVVEKEDDIWEIPGKGCYLCEKYRPVEEGRSGCCDCPLDSEVNTCGDIMEDIVGGSFAFQAEVNSGVWWRECGEGQEARAHIRKIRRALMKMERVGRRGR
ncbi:hypothetical protein ES703_31955 [subsurface metagenome]